ncbi:hypothetical protein SERLADRAFT_404670 [Serpula lacrymans var. lacrymans S7.9]|uniref:Uncharacterized protein n=1 Tax=Serpula lacrymans var. lacrymans (strain S7.9) TaxID=578457 RepID=F8NE17_SERL9|nr:uncharacterized protein SERLADRAFT_404670 [Serpula lacrymans var. lacrymans S7.9]EGO30545.1 hypothetical protein SERLADRAFT_404670 [Serpula lacrymans var. lacrymans S7.9]
MLREEVFGRGENEGGAVDPSMISQENETVDGFVWFDPGRIEALDNRCDPIFVVEEGEDGSSALVFLIPTPCSQALKAIHTPGHLLVRVVVEITRGIEDLERKCMEEGCKWCKLDKSACTISRSKQTKKWRMSCNKCSHEKYKCVWDNNASLGCKFWKPMASNPEASEALVTAPDHPIKIGPPHGAHKLVYQPHATAGTFTSRIPPPS